MVAHAEPAQGGRLRGPQSLYDALFGGVTRLFAVVVLVILGGVVLSLVTGSLPTFRAFGLAFIWHQAWNPVTSDFGALVPILGTLETSVIAMAIGIPLSFGVAGFITELCPVWLKRPLSVAIELLAGIPSIIYGIWGLFVLAPFLQHTIEPFLIATLGNVPGIDRLFKGPPYGIGVLTAGIILAVMVLPFISSIMRDVFETVPPMLKESAYGIGCTTWEVVWNIVLPYTKVGVVGGIMLGLGRVMGETMAVTFVIGNSHRLAASLLAPGQTIASALANEFTEAVDDFYQSALISLGLVLFVITFIVLAIAKLMLVRMQRGGGTVTVAFDMPRYRGRRIRNRIILSLSLMATAIGLLFLAMILGSLFIHGAAAWNWALFSQDTPPPGNAGGLRNAIWGSFVMTITGIAAGAPIGLLAGTYLAEYSRDSRFGQTVLFINDILLSAPSIIVGLFVYQAMVAHMHHFSAWAGSMALAILVVPVVVRTTVEMLKLVPNQLREAASALGTPKWKIVMFVTYRAAMQGLMTGVLLALARISGETAPLLFTSFGNQFWSTDMNAPMASLPKVIFDFALSPYDDWRQLAWGGALLITVAILCFNIAARSLAHWSSMKS